jgi:hypothetical protein
MELLRKRTFAHGSTNPLNLQLFALRKAVAIVSRIATGLRNELKVPEAQALPGRAAQEFLAYDF